MVWPLSISLAATLEIDVSFFSSGYLDVSVRRVPLHTLWIGVWIHEVFSCGFPHSDICGSMDICSSPQLFAAYHVFLRLLVPRHPPCALSCLTLLDVSYSVKIRGLRFFKTLELSFSVFLGCLDKRYLINLCMKFSRYHISSSNGSRIISISRNGAHAIVCRVDTHHTLEVAAQLPQKTFRTMALMLLTEFISHQGIQRIEFSHHR